MTEITEAMIKRGARALFTVARELNKLQGAADNHLTEFAQADAERWARNVLESARACILAALYDEAQAPAQSAELG